MQNGDNFKLLEGIADKLGALTEAKGLTLVLFQMIGK